MPLSGKSHVVKARGTGAPTEMPQGGVIDPRPRAVRASGTTAWNPSGHSGSWGQSMVVRVPGATGPGNLIYGCYDDFSRTVVDGWGTGRWCLPAWTTTPGSATRLGVSGGIGRLEIDYRDDGPFSNAGASIAYDTPGAHYAGRIEFRVRYTGDELDTVAFPLQAYISPTTAPTATGATEVYTAYTHSDIQGPFLEWLWTDHRTYSGGTWAYDYTGQHIEPFDVAWLADWWNVVLLCDEYGTYIRAWRDGEDEHVRDAPTQPTDTYGAGCLQGAGETWHAWEAYSVAETNPTLWNFGIGATANSPYTQFLDIDNVRLSEGFCPCGCCFDLFETEESGMWGGRPTWMGDWVTVVNTGDLGLTTFSPNIGHVAYIQTWYGSGDGKVKSNLGWQPDPAVSPMEILLKFGAYCDPDGQFSNQPSMKLGWTHSLGTSYVLVNDGGDGMYTYVNEDPRLAGADQSWYSASVFEPSGGDWHATPFPITWYWVRLVVDKWGTYARAWRNGEDEHGADAPAGSQPDAYFGDSAGRGLGQSWASWFCERNPANVASVTWQDLYIEVQAPAVDSAASFYYYFDEIRALRGASCCGRTRT